MSYNYTYNDLGNISFITNTENGRYMNYQYDTAGQLTKGIDRRENPDGSVDVLRIDWYNYDKAGNITSKYYTANGTTYDYLHFEYEDEDWVDLLTGVSGHDFTYDASGDPLTYFNGREYSFTWSGGRQLATAAVGGRTYSYTYDANGMRTGKTTTDGSVVYFVVDGVAVAEQKYYSNGTLRHTLKYLLDEDQGPIGVSINYPGNSYWSNYYFIRNVQGDVEQIVNSSGQVLVIYSYDPYGKLISTTDGSGNPIAATAASIANYNPFRYRGYYYDTETGFYYLQSRYYDPSIGRFLNADSLASTGLGFLGYNMFAYCNNNPVLFYDPTGRDAGTATLTLPIAYTIYSWLEGIAVSNYWNVIGWVALGAIVVVVGGYTIYDRCHSESNSQCTDYVVDTEFASASPPPNWNNDDDDDDDDDYYDDESNFGGRQRMGRSNGNTPRNNQVQNSQVDDIVQKTGLSDYGRRVLHNEITGKGLGYWEIMETAKQIAERGGKYVLWILEGN